LLELARQQLVAGWSTIVDAAFLRRADRAAFQALAAAAGAEFSILAPQATPAQLRERILARGQKGRDASEATLAVLDRQMVWIEALDAHELGYKIDSQMTLLETEYSTLHETHSR
jgi:predicted kinase